MQSKRKRVVFVATTTELNTPSYYRRLWIATRNISIARRSWLDEISNALRDFDGEIKYRTGKTFDIPCIDGAFGDDPDMRWMSYYLLADASDDYPRIQTRKILRLQLIDLYFRIRYPKIAAHFAV
jgi:hypothetical protein